METEILTAVVSVVGALAPTVPFLAKYKAKASQLQKLIGEIDLALEDNKLSPEEIKRIVKLGRGLL